MLLLNMFLGEKRKKSMAKNSSWVLENSRNGAFEIKSTENQETKVRWATERRDKTCGTKGRALAEVKWGRIPSKGPGRWEGPWFVHPPQSPMTGWKSLLWWLKLKSCLNVRYSIVLIALVLKWIQGKKAKGCHSLWHGRVIYKRVSVAIVYQKGLFSWNGLFAKFIKMDN